MVDFPFLRNTDDLVGKRVLLRLDINLSVKDGAILDDARIRRVLPTIDYLKKHNARVIVLSHRSEKNGTLAPIASRMNTITPTVFAGDIFDTKTFEKTLNGNPGMVVVCENLRFYDGEKKNDLDFAKQLAATGDVFVNDAFAASHRAHASIVSLPRFLPSYAGFLFEEEVKNLSLAFAPQHPFVFVLGGGKAGTKLPFIESFLERADTVFVAGAVAHNFFKCRGYEIGRSLYEIVDVDYCTFEGNERMMLPVDVRVENREGIFYKKPSEVEKDDMILDVGPGTLSALKEKIMEARFIIWNGPLGDYLKDGFEKGTYELVQMLKESDAQKIVGGGDSTAIISELHAEDAFDYISTAGGAMLEFLAKRTLPGIEALKTSI